jgi:hypothetical protein
MTISLRSRTARRLVVGGTALAVVFGGVVGTSGVANAATTSSSDASAVRAEVRAIMHSLPSSLRTDVHHAMQQKTKESRHTALVAVEQKAASGGYGATAKTIAADVKADWSSVPKGMQHRATALVSGRHEPLLRDVRGMLRRALAGKAGATLQQQLHTVAAGLPAVPAPTGKPSASSGS